MNGLAKYRGIHATKQAAVESTPAKQAKGPSNADVFKASKIAVLDSPESASGSDLSMGLHYGNEALLKDDMAGMAIFAILFACAMKGESLEVAKERIRVLTEKHGGKFGVRAKGEIPPILQQFRKQYASWNGEIKLPKVK